MSIVTKGTKLKVRHHRKGTFIGVATKDFDPAKETFYPIAIAEEAVTGLTKTWEVGEETPCRNSLCSIEVVE